VERVLTRVTGREVRTLVHVEVSHLEIEGGSLPQAGGILVRVEQGHNRAVGHHYGVKLWRVGDVEEHVLLFEPDMVALPFVPGTSL